MNNSFATNWAGVAQHEPLEDALQVVEMGFVAVQRQNGRRRGNVVQADRTGLPQAGSHFGVLNLQLLVESVSRNLSGHQVQGPNSLQAPICHEEDYGDVAH